MDLRELQEWFAPEELDPCPRCVDIAALSIEHSESLLCFQCGFIRWSGGETSVRQIQEAVPSEAPETPVRTR